NLRCQQTDVLLGILSDTLNDSGCYYKFYVRDEQDFPLHPPGGHFAGGNQSPKPESRFVLDEGGNQHPGDSQEHDFDNNEGQRRAPEGRQLMLRFGERRSNRTSTTSGTAEAKIS